ncbi:MAG TPA: hypothetical protein VFP50_12345 [Anaeromyxobacteraceae bacterium]|nr:hypothetical protein [Anaeromyxobacteraceae bacterium]
MRTRLASLATSLVLVTAPAGAWASSAAGLMIEVGKFRLEVRYSVALDYADGADRPIKDPRQALFALASLIQANQQDFAQIAHTITFELGKGADAETMLLAEEDLYVALPARTYVRLQDRPVSPDVVKEIVAILCGRYAGACRVPPAKHVDLFPCGNGSCPGQIRFGSFPSTSVNERFGLLPPARNGVHALRVTADDIGRHFAKLD